MTALDDISLKIGRIEAEIENARRSREVTHQRIEKIDKRFEGLSRQLEELAMVVRDVAAMKPEVQHYADTRRRFAGAAAVLVALGGVAGGLVGWLAGLPRH